MQVKVASNFLEQVSAASIGLCNDPVKHNVPRQFEQVAFLTLYSQLYWIERKFKYVSIGMLKQRRRFSQFYGLLPASLFSSSWKYTDATSRRSCPA